MAKYRKKPIVVEVEQFLPFEDDMGRLVSNLVDVVRDGDSPTGFSMHTLEDTKKPHEVTSKDWIITGVAGEKYPCKPDIFDKTYEKVEE